VEKFRNITELCPNCDPPVLDLWQFQVYSQLL
jgi:hypothetical protein